MYKIKRWDRDDDCWEILITSYSWYITQKIFARVVSIGDRCRVVDKNEEIVLDGGDILGAPIPNPRDHAATVNALAMLSDIKFSGDVDLAIADQLKWCFICKMGVEEVAMDSEYIKINVIDNYVSAVEDLIILYRLKGNPDLDVYKKEFDIYAIS